MDLDYSYRFDRPAREALQGAGVDAAIHNIYGMLVQIAEICREARVVGPVLHVPDPTHPPRHGKLADGVLARNVAEDLSAVIAQGRALDRDLAAGTRSLPALKAWADSLFDGDALRGFDVNCGAMLQNLSRGVMTCGDPAVPDSAVLARAHLAFALEFLEELMDRLPDYAEASGQGKPRDPVTVIANNSNVSVADTVNNIGTVIQAVADRGDAGVADALRALTAAIERDQELTQNLRAQLLDNVADVADAVAAPNEPRRRSRARAAMTAIATAAGASSELAQAVSTWQSVLGRLF